jgi:hypothetical protein
MVYTSSPPLSSNALEQELVKSMWSEFAIVTLVLAARFYTRIHLVNRVGWDDAVIFLSYVSTVFALSEVCKADRGRDREFGRIHIEQLSRQQWVRPAYHGSEPSTCHKCYQMGFPRTDLRNYGLSNYENGLHHNAH